MKRLTSHFKYDGIDRAFAKNFDDLDFLQEVANKLGQKEDDDEELGIDSHILFKALRDGFYWKGKNVFGIEGIFFEENPELDIKNKIIKHILFKKNQEYVYIKDYGETWALTKEELE